MDPNTRAIQTRLHESRSQMLPVIARLGSDEKNMVESLKADYAQSSELWPLVLVYLTSYAQIRDNLNREGVYDIQLVQ